MEQTEPQLPKSGDIDESRLAPSAEAFRQPENHQFRKRYRKLNPQEELLADAIKDKANEIATLFKQVTLIDSNGSEIPGVIREISLAMEHLEDCVYRAIKAVTA